MPGYVVQCPPDWRRYRSNVKRHRLRFLRVNIRVIRLQFSKSRRHKESVKIVMTLRGQRSKVQRSNRQKWSKQSLPQSPPSREVEWISNLVARVPRYEMSSRSGCNYTIYAWFVSRFWLTLMKVLKWKIVIPPTALLYLYTCMRIHIHLTPLVLCSLV